MKEGTFGFWWMNWISSKVTSIKKNKPSYNNWITLHRHTILLPSILTLFRCDHNFTYFSYNSQRLKLTDYQLTLSLRLCTDFGPFLNDEVILNWLFCSPSVSLGHENLTDRTRGFSTIDYCLKLVPPTMTSFGSGVRFVY